MVVRTYIRCSHLHEDEIECEVYHRLAVWYHVGNELKVPSCM